MAHGPPFSKEEARRSIEGALCWSDALRALGYQPRGYNIRTLQRWARRWEIDTGHFDAVAVRRRSNRRRRIPLEEVLVEGSTYHRGHLKERLLEEGLKQRVCELCGVGEMWHGKRMSLVLDHVNGISDDHRLENLRIVCANCAATLDTHCGRNVPRERVCPACGRVFRPREIRHRYCTLTCFNELRSQLSGQASEISSFGEARPSRRRVKRPPYEQLLREIEETSYLAVGRKYGVSDNAIRKWVRQYEREEERRKAQGLRFDRAA